MIKVRRTLPRLEQRISLRPQVSFQCSNEVISKMAASTHGRSVFLHRTREESAISILQTGLKYADDIYSTATHSPTNQKRAFHKYTLPHKSSDVVVIIVLPIPGREIWRCRKSGGDINEDIVSKFYSSIGTIRPRYIKGYFIVETGIFVSNPKFSPEFPQKPFKFP